MSVFITLWRGVKSMVLPEEGSTYNNYALEKGALCTLDGIYCVPDRGESSHDQASTPQFLIHLRRSEEVLYIRLSAS